MDDILPALSSHRQGRADENAPTWHNCTMAESSYHAPPDPSRFVLDPAFDVPYRHPWAATIARQRVALGDAEAGVTLLASWQRIDLGDLGGTGSFPWLTSSRLVDPVAYAGDPRAWTPWRADDRRLDLTYHEFEHRFLAPVVHAEGAETLLAWSRSDDPRLAGPASALWKVLEPRVGWEIASHVAAGDPWKDSLTLWLLARHALLLDTEGPLALAIATRLAAFARRRDGKVVGLKFPFFEKFLASATAQLASALIVLGQDLDLAAELIRCVTEDRGDDGSWRDAGNPSDVLTTLVAADLALGVDPEFDPGPTAAFLDARRTPRGTWRAFGPEEPWLTAEVLSWKRRAARAFPERFLWPRVVPATLDRKLGIPSYAWFEQVTDLFAALPGISRLSLVAAFIDLAGFGKFNNRSGQDTGDEVLRRFAAHLAATLPGGRPCRDGGDEFLVVGTPGAVDVEGELRAMRASWPVAFHAAFGSDVPPVAPRVVVVTCRCAELRAARRVLGQAIAGLKAQHPLPPETGVELRLDGIG
jgi:hypothetical protein